MKRLIMRIMLYIKSKELWDAKMSEPLQIRVISNPQK